MSLSHDSARDDQLVLYLLGLLGPDESERLDALCLTDDEMAGRWQAVENDLVDGYVTGTLNPSALMQFERAYLTTAHRRDKVQFAESLRQATMEQPAAARAG